MELVIYKPTEDGFPKEITFNDEQIKQELAIKLEKYNGLVYGDESIKEAKADRATLNKFKEAIESKRIDIKKQCLNPYSDFEKKIKGIVAMIDKPIAAIDTQIKNYEQVKKDDKLTAIKQFYADKVADLKDLVPFEKIYNLKWLNATYKETDIQKEITDLFIKVESDLQVIAELNTKYEPQLKDFYLKGYDLTSTLREKKRLEEQAVKLAEHKRMQEEKKAAAVKAKTQNANQIKTGSSSSEPPIQHQEVHHSKQQLLTVDFRVSCTAEQLKALRKFMLDNNISFGRVPTEQSERQAV